MSELQEIKDDFAWGIKVAGEGQGYTNLDDKQVSWLISQLEQAQVEYIEERNAHNAHVAELCKLQAENEQLKADKQKYERELEWYGDDGTYRKWDVNNFEFADIDKDKGYKARRVLSEVKGNG